MTDHEQQALRVRLVADPGLPTRRAEAARDRLQVSLSSTLGRRVRVQVSSRRVRVEQDHRITLSGAKQLNLADRDADVVLLLTELPRFVDDRPLMAVAFPGEGVGLVSLPTLGVLLGERVIAGLLGEVALVALGERAEGLDRSEAVRRARWSQREDGSWALRTGRVTGRSRLVAGMVVSNEPWAAAPKLTGAFAAAAATASFGMFYNSIWKMADVMSEYRLVIVALLSVLFMTGWLIVGNRLWEKGDSAMPVRLVALYNMSTVLTMAMAVSALWVLLFVLMLIGTSAVIPPAFMTEVIGHSAEPNNYLRVAWFSSAMGVVAGGLGVSFDDDADLRLMTHAQRERAGMPDPDEDEREDDGEGAAERKPSVVA
ncbi:hypothetical protein [Kytococcus aerolatus]|uniref:hypothetical protein n=1 Tax=Kytococcus aerolatus TaxID=592308 RepID=UPI00117B073C|nr:hypothetical protein [Kytococcus aerolatus]